MDRVLAIDGVEDLIGKKVFKGLFGDDLVMYNDKYEKPTVSVATKLTPTEAAQLEELAYKFGVSKCKFIRDCITHRMKELAILIEP